MAAFMAGDQSIAPLAELYILRSGKAPHSHVRAAAAKTKLINTRGKDNTENFACGGLARSSCGACGVSYCSPACQKVAWPAHRGVCSALSRAHFSLRASTGFLLPNVKLDTVVGDLPVRLLTQLDGLGALGAMVYCSDHCGLDSAPLAAAAMVFGASAAEITSEAGLYAGYMWDSMTIPLRSCRELPPGCVAVHPAKGIAAAHAAVAAGLASWRPDIAAEPAGFYEGGAPILQLLGVASWRKLSPRVEE